MIKCDKGFYREKEIKENINLIRLCIAASSIILNGIIGSIFDDHLKNTIIGNIEGFFGILFLMSIIWFGLLVLTIFFEDYRDIFRGV